MRLPWLAALPVFLAPHLAHAAPTEAASAPASEAQRLDNALVLDLGLAVVGLAYERKTAPRVTFQVEGHVFGTWFGPIVDLPNMTGFGAQIRPSFFLTDDAPRGVYLSPFLRIDRVTTEANGVTGHGTGFSTGLFAGYAFVFADRFHLRLGAGVQFMSYEVPTGPTHTSFRSFFPAIDLLVGYAF